jgi:DNA segregation ATPase FtsK/SpoIIIE, S-DNA-T family
VVEEAQRSVPRQAVRVIRTVAKHERSRAIARNAAYLGIGLGVVFRRQWDSRSTARYKRWIRSAEATGNHEAALEWEDRLARFRKERHQRRTDMIEIPVKVLLQVPKIAVGLLAVLLAIGTLLAIATRHVAEIAAPVKVLAKATEITAVVVSVAWGPLLLSAPWIAAAALWWTGRKHATTLPGWVAAAGQADMDVTIDETTLARALEALRIQQISAYIKEGLPLQYVTPCRRGTHAVIRLPAGVTAERIAQRRADLATGPYRLSKEVWPTTGDEAGILDLWIADKGVLNEGAGSYPLLEQGLVDVFRGVPFGKTLRGDPQTAPLMERNTIVGGMPGQGKSSAARVIMAGAALDPTAELRIWVPDTNFDFECFQPRCSRYVMGAEDERIGRIRDDLAELRDEVQARGQLLIDYQVPAVTRELASAGVGLHPLFCLLEEAHIAITHTVYGKEISGLLVEVVKLGRKRGIHVIVSTQAPTKDSMPRDVTRNCSNGIAYAVGDHVANDALLGQGAYRGGHRATELIPGTDRGTCLVKGFTGERSVMAQAYYLDVARGNDQVTPIIRRSLAEIAHRGRGVPGGDRPAIESRDLLEDLDEVLGAERVKLRDAIGLLRGLAPGWGRYKRMTAKQLAADLAAEGVRTVNSSGTPYLDPADLHRALEDQTATDQDDG